MEVVSTPTASRSFNFGPLFIASAALLWTTDAVARSSLEGKLTSDQVVFLEHLIINLLLAYYLVKFLPGLAEFSRKDFGALLYIGVGGSALATIALTQGFFTGDNPFQYVAVVVLLQQTQPIVAIGLAAVLLKEKLPRYYYLLSSISIVGVYMMLFPTFTGGSQNFYDLQLVATHFQSTTGLLAASYGLLAAVLWGGSTVFGRYLMKYSDRRLEFMQMTTYRFFIALVFLAILVSFSGQLVTDGVLFTSQMDSSATLAVLYIALVVGLFSLILYYYGLQRTQASVATLFELAYPLSAFFLIPLLNLKPLLPIQFVGAILLVAGAGALSYFHSEMDEDA